MPKRKLVGQSVRKKAAGSRPEKETVRSRSTQKVGGKQQEVRGSSWVGRPEKK